MKDNPVIKTLIKVFTSLKLAVVVLALSMVVVFLGSVAQHPMGDNIAVERYFKSWFVDTVAIDAALGKCAHMFFDIEREIIAAGELRKKGAPCFPGGYLLGTVLLVNMLAAYYSRVRISWKKGGVLLTHLGVIVLMLGQFITDQITEESYVSLTPGERRNYTESFDDMELAVLTRHEDGSEKVVSIPEHLLEKEGLIEHPALKDLQFTVRGYWVNADVAVRLIDFLRNYVGQEKRRVEQAEKFLRHMRSQVTADQDAADLKLTPKEWKDRLGKYADIDSSFVKAFRGQLEQYHAITVKTKENGGAGEQVVGYVQDKPPTFANDERNMPAVWVEYLEPPAPEPKPNKDVNGTTEEAQAKSGGSPQTRNLLIMRGNRELSLGEGELAPRVVFRPKRLYHGYTLTLVDLKWEYYPGTGIPRNFESILKVEAPGSETRQANIYMNHPLRMEGETYYQNQMNSSEFSSNMLETRLQVIQNPSWLTAYIGCLVVSVGMLWQFLGHLIGFIRKRKEA